MARGPRFKAVIGRGGSPLVHGEHNRAEGRRPTRSRRGLYHKPSPAVKTLTIVWERSQLANVAKRTFTKGWLAGEMGH